MQLSPLIAGAALALTPLAALALPLPVGDPAKPAALPAALQQAYAGGARELTINPGTYLLPLEEGRAIEFRGWKNAVIHAQGVTLIIAQPARAALIFKECENVAFDGATLRYQGFSSAQGRIKNVGKDADGPYFDWQLDAGYTAKVDPENPKSYYDVVDRQTRLFKPGTGDIHAKDVQNLGPNLLRLRGVSGTVGPAGVGDWLVTRQRGGDSLVHLQDSSHCTMQGLTLKNAGFAAFFETGGQGGHHYVDCRVARGPLPPGATEEQLVACGKDGFHSARTIHGPIIERCVWEGVLLDDCIAIHGSYQKVLRAQANKLIIQETNRGDFNPGEPVRVSAEDGFFGEATCTAYRSLDGGQGEITLDKALAAPAGAMAGNPGRCGQGYKIVNCTLGNTRSRGILVKADNGTITGCTIDGCVQAAISIGPEYYWGESDYCKNVLVSGNIIRHCNLSEKAPGALWVHGEGSVGNRGIAILNNQFVDNYGPSPIGLDNLDGGRIEGNRFSMGVAGTESVVDLADSQNITLRGNIISSANRLPTPVKMDRDCKGVVGNDATGLQFASSHP